MPLSSVERSHRAPRRKVYPVWGVLLAAGAPLGLLVLRWSLECCRADLDWVGTELHANRITYGYLIVSTSIVFAVLGWLLGRKEDEIVLTSITDVLTGLANRRLFDVRLRDALLRSQRYGEPVSLLAIDVDGLKALNDVHGHAGGDLAIRTVADAIAQTVRAADLAARTGGDEFAVLAPETTGEQALELADRVRAALARKNPPGIPVPTISIGVADLNRAGAGRPEALCAAADRALYAAKTSGRDRAVLAELVPFRHEEGRT